MSGNGRFRPWNILGSKTVYDQAPFVQVAVQTVQLPDGRIVDDYHQIALAEVGVILAVDADGRLIMLRQYRHGLRCDCHCLPGGGMLPGESLEAGARRELLEETGYVAARWRHLGSAAPNANYGCGREHYFLATGLQKIQAADSGDLEETDILHLTRAEVEGLIDRQEVMVTGVLAGLLLYLRHAGQDGEGCE